MISIILKNKFQTRLMYYNNKTKPISQNIIKGFIYNSNKLINNILRISHYYKINKLLYKSNNQKKSQIKSADKKQKLHV